MNRFIASASIILTAVAFCLLAACSNPASDGISTPAPTWELLPTRTPAPTEAPPAAAADLSAPLFSLSLSEFIERFNACYRRDHGLALLRPADEWVELTPQNGLRLFRFQSDPSLSADPAILIWSVGGDAPMERLCLDFSDHGYTNENRIFYEKLCRCAFLCAGFDQETAGRLFDTLFSLANNETYAGGDYDAPPIRTLCHNGELGLYPWYSGGVVHIDMIPVDEALLDSLAESGTELLSLKAEEGEVLSSARP